MKKEVLGLCPICGERLEVTHLHCPQCDIDIKGQFELCRFCHLTREQKEFLEVFIKCRGNIKDVEKELGISYPTVKNRLENVISALGLDDTAYTPADDFNRKMGILAKLDRGEISASEAIKLLNDGR
ncbi:DUF2089 domain-containing protein [Caldanaerobius polysaccharolyticus]|uniref:DUF2089 domain-containing protein n=1 Tax=Caldanaerobius polysaccharolyticus TaxID=44256 RepID=UPI000478DC6E|nr:DUF2089 domain-containing protein [Caldanaerobius polysaccharolyticus]